MAGESVDAVVRRRGDGRGGHAGRARGGARERRSRSRSKREATDEDIERDRSVRRRGRGKSAFAEGQEARAATSATLALQEDPPRDSSAAVSGSHGRLSESRECRSSESDSMSRRTSRGRLRQDAARRARHGTSWEASSAHGESRTRQLSGTAQALACQRGTRGSGSLERTRRTIRRGASISPVNISSRALLAWLVRLDS